MTSSDRSRELVGRAWGEFGKSHRFDSIKEFFAPTYVRHSDSGDYSRDELGALMDSLVDAFPDLKTVRADVIAEGDRVAYRWESTGTHRGTYMGAPPTQRLIRVGGINIARIEGDLIAEEWSSWDKVSFLHSLGIIHIGG